MTKQERVLAHVARYRLTTTRILDRLYFPADTPAHDARKSVVKQLTRQGYLASAPLLGEGREVYYHLTAAGAVHLGFPETYGGIGQDLVRAYARLLFCCAQKARPRFTAAEFDAAFPGLRPAGSQLFRDFPGHAYYLDTDSAGTRRLGRILDIAGHFKPAVVGAALSYAEGAFPALVADNRFCLALVVATVAKRQEIARALAEAPPGGQRHLRILIEDYRELLPLVELRAEARARRG